MFGICGMVGKSDKTLLKAESLSCQLGLQGLQRIREKFDLLKLSNRVKTYIRDIAT